LEQGGPDPALIRIGRATLDDTVHALGLVGIAFVLAGAGTLVTDLVRLAIERISPFGAPVSVRIGAELDVPASR
jgi:hypothetical protein